MGTGAVSAGVAADKATGGDCSHAPTLKASNQSSAEQQKDMTSLAPNREGDNAVQQHACDDGEEYEEYDFENEICLRAKWMFDGAGTIDECIELCKAQIKYLQELKDEGWELTDSVHDDYGYLRKDGQ